MIYSITVTLFLFPRCSTILYRSMKTKIISFRIRIKGKLTILLFQLKQVGKIIISKIISIQIKLKGMIAYSSFLAAAIVPLPMAKHEINELPLAKTPIEQRISQPGLQFAPTAPEPKIKVFASEYPKCEISSKGLFGQPRKIKNNNSSFTEIKETEKLLEIRGGQFSSNGGHCVFEELELLRHKAGLSPTRKKPTPKYPTPKYSAFIQRQPPFGEIGNQPPVGPGGKQSYDRNLERHAHKPKMSDEKFNAFLNRPADVAKGKLETKSSIPEGVLEKEAQKTLQKSDRQKTANGLINKFQSGNSNPGIGTRTIHGTPLFELRGDDGTRVIYLQKDDTMEIFEICDKANQKKVFSAVRELFSKK
jgi:hypothetical protein